MDRKSSLNKSSDDEFVIVRNGSIVSFENEDFDMFSEDESYSENEEAAPAADVGSDQGAFVVSSQVESRPSSPSLAVAPVLPTSLFVEDEQEDEAVEDIRLMFVDETFSDKEGSTLRYSSSSSYSLDSSGTTDMSSSAASSDDETASASSYSTSDTDVSPVVDAAADTSAPVIMVSAAAESDSDKSDHSLVQDAPTVDDKQKQAERLQKIWSIGQFNELPNSEYVSDFMASLSENDFTQLRTRMTSNTIMHAMIKDGLSVSFLGALEDNDFNLLVVRYNRLLQLGIWEGAAEKSFDFAWLIKAGENEFLAKYEAVSNRVLDVKALINFERLKTDQKQHMYDFILNASDKDYIIGYKRLKIKVISDLIILNIVDIHFVNNLTDKVFGIFCRRVGQPLVFELLADRQLEVTCAAFMKSEQFAGEVERLQSLQRNNQYDDMESQQEGSCKMM